MSTTESDAAAGAHAPAPFIYALCCALVMLSCPLVCDSNLQLLAAATLLWCVPGMDGRWLVFR